MKFTRDQKAEAFDRLPKDLKVVVMSNALERAFQEIGNQNRLSLDKTGALEELVIVTILGLLPREELQNNLQKELSLSTLQASTIAKSINENVFLKIREILQQEESGENTEEENNLISTEQGSTQYPDLNKDSILAEIENPVPAVHPISIADQTIAGPVRPREIISLPTETKESVAKDFIAGKLTETVSLPSQRVNVTPQTVEKPRERPKNYNTDPYREPIS
ncbi:MAG: hypothetical protein AAB922_01770 [Patescibacteria group bacterium]